MTTANQSVMTPDIPADPRERALWIISQLKLRGLSIAAVARAGKCHRHTVRNALFLPSHPQEVALATALGLDPKALFADRYGPDGQRLHHVRGPNPTKQGRRRNVYPHVGGHTGRGHTDDAAA